MTDAQNLSTHSERMWGRSSPIQVADVKIALQSHLNTSFTLPPPREFLLEAAKTKNSIPLPSIENEGYSMLLPAERLVKFRVFLCCFLLFVLV